MISTSRPRCRRRPCVACLAFLACESGARRAACLHVPRRCCRQRPRSPDALRDPLLPRTASAARFWQGAARGPSASGLTLATPSGWVGGWIDGWMGAAPVNHLRLRLRLSSARPSRPPSLAQHRPRPAHNCRRSPARADNDALRPSPTDRPHSTHARDASASRNQRAQAIPFDLAIHPPTAPSCALHVKTLSFPSARCHCCPTMPLAWCNLVPRLRTHFTLMN